MSEEQKPCGDEPKRKKRELGPKQQRLVKALPKAASIAQAGRSAGYGTKQAALRAYKGIKERAPEILERIGYGQEVVLGNLGKLTGATETKFFADKGIVLETREVEANDIRLRANVELAKIHGAYEKDESQPDASHRYPPIVINLGFLDRREAEALLAGQSGRSADR